MDVHLSGVNGIEAAKTIRSDVPRARIVVISTEDRGPPRSGTRGGCRGISEQTPARGLTAHALRRASRSPGMAARVAEFQFVHITDGDAMLH